MKAFSAKWDKFGTRMMEIMHGYVEVIISKINYDETYPG
jgi:hypothetical protein